MTDKIFLVKAKNIVDYIKLLNLDVNTNDIVFKELTSKELELIKDLVEEQYRNVPRDEWKALLKKLEGLK